MSVVAHWINLDIKDPLFPEFQPCTLRASLVLLPQGHPWKQFQLELAGSYGFFKEQ